MKKISHYNTLIDIGLLSNAEKQLKAAQDTLSFDDNYDFSVYTDFYWNFNKTTKKEQFDAYFDELDISKFVSNQMDSILIKKEDVLLIHTQAGYIYCSYSRSVVEEIALNNYNEAGLLPYHITKRKIKNRIIWFCLAWISVPFIPPNYN